ncbi:MAG: hypothetical protein RJA19_1392, partial [Bacteroidota bacterium]
MYFGAMKKCYTSAILLGVAGLMTLPLGAQMLYDNADDVRQVTYGFNVPFLQQLGNGTGGTQWPGWHGTLIEYAANPFPDAVNGSAQCLAYLRNPGETYDVIVIRTSGLADLTDYVNGTKQIRLDVLSPVPGVDIEITLEDAETALPANYPIGRHSTYHAVTTTGGQWETLTFSLVGQPDATVPMDAVDNVVILMNPGVNVSEQYYLDNFFGPEWVSPDCATPGDEPAVVSDFDCNQRVTRIYSDGRLQLFPNPAPFNALNNSVKCLEYTRNGAVTDDVWVGAFADGPLTVVAGTQMFLQTMDPTAPSDFVLSLQDTFGNELLLLTDATGVPGVWEEHVFDLSALAGFPNVARFVFLYRPGIPEARSIYLDGWRVESPDGLADVVESGRFRVFPNPVVDVLRWEGELGSRWSVVDAMGREVVQGVTRAEAGFMDVSDWAEGVYLMQWTWG